MNRAVERGISRRIPDDVPRIGIDEKSFRRGHKYVTLLNDLDGGRVLDVVEDRTQEASEKLLQTLTPQQRIGVTSVSVDMWKPFASAIEKLLPNADIVHDHFHISKYLNDAVDMVRRQESRALVKDGDNRLVGSKFNWLRNPENMNEKQKSAFDKLSECELKTGVAWSQKNIFREFWSCSTEFSAKLFFGQWCDIVERSDLKPMMKVKELLERHIDNILNFFTHRVTNAVSEGLNSKIQMIKAAARGFHSFISYRTRILFYCGKLDMKIS
jgi:transposase